MGANGSWHGKTVLITGGSGCNGRSIAKKFLNEGAFVVLADINLQKIKAMSELFHALSFLAVHTDVTKPAECLRAVETCINISGSLDLLINAAGAWVDGNTALATEEEWDRVIDVNLKGTFFMCRYSIRHLEKTKGSILNISSIDSLNGNAGAAIYGASKAGVNHLTQSLALELAPLGIRVNAICPCYVQMSDDHSVGRAVGFGERNFFQRDLLPVFQHENRVRLAAPEEIADFVFSVSGAQAAPTTGAFMPIEFIASGV
jgi:NAD(P)-dependent dehydrogenase (short-subunit alcohol dehydrogenase family)